MPALAVHVLGKRFPANDGAEPVGKEHRSVTFDVITLDLVHAAEMII